MYEDGLLSCIQVEKGRRWLASWHNFRIAGSWKVIPCFRTFREALNYPYISFFHLLVNCSVTCFCTFWRPLTFFIVVGGEELKWRQLVHNQLMNPQGPHFSPQSRAKTNDKSTNLSKNSIYWYKCCCDRFSILRENRLKKLIKIIIIIIIMNKSQETTVFRGLQKLTSTMKLRPEKWR